MPDADEHRPGAEVGVAGPVADETLATARMPVVDHERAPGIAPPTTAMPTFAPPPGGGMSPPPTEAPKSSAPLIALVVAGVAALIVIALIAIWFRNRGDDGTTTEAGVDTSAVVEDSSTITTTPAESTTTSTRPDLLNPSSTTTSPSTSRPSQTSTTASTAEQVAMFRGLLEDNGLTSDELSDTDVVQFGTSFCALARISDATTFDDYRDQAISETEETDLSDDELKLVIDAAVLSFCPNEAERLGIEL
ncbi:MAG: hypothetical protein ACK5RL_15505 [Acidimicrobiales bacterium]